VSPGVQGGLLHHVASFVRVPKERIREPVCVGKHWIKGVHEGIAIDVPAIIHESVGSQHLVICRYPRSDSFVTPGSLSLPIASGAMADLGLIRREEERSVR
jgi:hypothetical protein